MANALVDAEWIERENRKGKAGSTKTSSAGPPAGRAAASISKRIVERVRRFTVAVPSWGVGTGGTRFARFPGPGEPRNVFEKLEDCATIFRLSLDAGRLAAHSLGQDRTALASCATSRGHEGCTSTR